jgi:chromosome partitioning protein
MCKRVTITNGKGGVGASTTVVNLGYWLSQHCWYTLILETDHQADCGQLIGGPTGDTAADFLKRKLEYLEDSHFVLVREPSLFVLPSNDTMAGVASTLTTQLNHEGTVEGKRSVLDVMARRMYEAGDQFAIILVDPPKSGPMQQAALVGADTLIVPFMIDFPSMNNTIGFVQLAHTLLPEGARIFLLPIGLPMGKVEGVSQIKPTREEKSYLDTIREQCQCPGRDVVLAEGIPLQKTARKASFKGQTIFEVAPDGAVAQAYDKFCRQVFGL